TFSAAASAAMCRPAASRASRNNTGRLTAAGDSRVCSSNSLIECPSLIRRPLGGLRKTPPQLLGKLCGGHVVVHLALDLDAQPQGLGVGQFRVVDTADDELRALVVAPAVLEAGQVVGGNRVAGVEF